MHRLRAWAQKPTSSCKETHFKTNLTLWKCGKEMVFLVSGAKKIKIPCEKKKKKLILVSHRTQLWVTYQSNCGNPPIQLPEDSVFFLNQARDTLAHRVQEALRVEAETHHLDCSRPHFTHTHSTATQKLLNGKSPH